MCTILIKYLRDQINHLVKLIILELRKKALYTEWVLHRLIEYDVVVSHFNAFYSNWLYNIEVIIIGYLIIVYHN